MTSVSPDKDEVERIIRQLRELAAFNRGKWPLTAQDGFIALGDEAADLIDRLAAMSLVDRLREALERIVLQRQLGKNADVLAGIARAALSSPEPVGEVDED